MSKRDELLAKIAARKNQLVPTVPTIPTKSRTAQEIARANLLAKLARIPKPAPVLKPTTSIGTQESGSFLTWNPEQLQAIQYGTEGKSFCLIGAAGTGKTTTVKEITRQLIENSTATISNNCPSKYLIQGFPAISFVSFTNRAVQNIKKAVSEVQDMDKHALTIHKLLEYFPNQIEVFDEANNEWRKSMRFEPTFHAYNTIKDLKLIVIDESSMVGCELFKKLHDACPNATFIFIGDLNQLAPVFGDAILGFKLSEIPVVELTRVYRQAMESPIVAFQHNYTLKGKLPSDTELAKITAEDRGLKFTPFKAKISSPEVLCKAVANKMNNLMLEDKYDPTEDIILIPFNKEFGSTLLNQEIAQFLGDKRDAVVYEIIAGFEKKYFAVGDYVLFEKEEYTVSNITKNPSYVGKRPQQESVYLKRDGYYKPGHDLDIKSLDDSLFDAINKMIDGDDVENQSSHEIELVSSKNSERTKLLNTRGELNALDFGYAITVHKSQGSEWKRVFFILTNHHAVMLSREILYTGMTRAREELEVIYDPQSGTGKKDSTVAKAIFRQRIKGKTWRDKVEYFKGKYDQYSAIMAGEE